MSTNEYTNKIGSVQTTNETLTGRGGISVFAKYLESVKILPILEEKFGSVRKSAKGLPIWLLYKVIFCFFVDGTSNHLVHFDRMKDDEGFAGAIEIDPSKMPSSHAVKRFFMAMGWWIGKVFRSVLHILFVWRLKIAAPVVVEIYCDTMVMNNDDAEKREGVSPTYKNVKGFQPLHFIWNNKIIDAIFRGGNKNGNTGNTVINVMTELVRLIRREYMEGVTIIFKFDAGFFDQEIFAALNELNVGFIGTGKMYDGVKIIVANTEEDHWKTFECGDKEWNFVEFGFACANWKFFLRAIYTTFIQSGQQIPLFGRPDNVIVTNIGVNEKVLENCPPELREELTKPETLIHKHHQNGKDELVHRGIKDFASEKLPFTYFGANAAYYYCMVISFFLFETFKEDVLEGVVPLGSYATTVRRKAIDFAMKVVKNSRKIILKISKPVFEALRFDLLWERSQNPPPIVS